MDILLLTFNRLDFLKRTIDAIYKRIKTPFRLIVVDNVSEDGTREFLQNDKRIHKAVLLDEPATICKAYDIGFKEVESDIFIMMQDDVIVPKLQPDCFTQLKDLLDKNPDHGGIACRIQRIPNAQWTDGDLTPARKALSAYCRIQRKADYEAMGGLGDRNWDDLQFVKKIREGLGKKVSWANNIWCDHIGYMCPNKGYGKFKRRWGYSVEAFKNYLKKPYREIDPETNAIIPKSELRKRKS